MKNSEQDYSTFQQPPPTKKPPTVHHTSIFRKLGEDQYEEDEVENLLDSITSSYSRKDQEESPKSSKYRYVLIGVVVVFLVMLASYFLVSSLVTSNSTQSTMSDKKPAVVTESRTTNTKPNFIFILADDLGYESVNYAEHDLDFVSPYLTSLMKEGIQIENYYSQEVCTPARAALMTGRYPTSLGMQYKIIYDTIPWGVSTAETFLPEVLRDQGDYINYGLGKWHLGHYKSNLLPTARGFHHFLGYLSGDNYYWSKRAPDYPQFVDFLYMDTECYAGYDKEDIHTYSTNLYTNKAKKIITSHDFSANPMFLYMSYQAVHFPYYDDKNHLSGITGADVSFYDDFVSKINGTKRIQQALSLRILDSAIEDLLTTVKEVGQLDNTYVIFASDNGGCVVDGGRNGDLRGSKGTLFEGGTKVDAFVYSPLLPSSVRGTRYTNLMHVSDWFPTILGLAGIDDYVAKSGYEVDGVNHATALLDSTASTPRDHILYNMYYNVADYYFDLETNGSFAVRNSRYKLIHAYSGNYLAGWNPTDEPIDDDDWMHSTRKCGVSSAGGTFEKFLFDLENDPNEKTNLYGIAEYAEVQAELYALADAYKSKVQLEVYPASSNQQAKSAFKEYGYIVPYSKADVKNGLSYCTPTSLFVNS